ncbi:MAG: class I SAM-dependent methyltransferase [Rhodobacteraceae bacterium]|nr:class I SAM-dependent methyltransferase [Paracoccaceae bacterium]
MMREDAERFDGLAEAYAAFRPGYPAAAFRDISANVTSPLRRALDLGAGPGNSTLSLREALGPEWTIAAVEPGRDMRRVLARRLGGQNGVMILDACVEALPLPTGFASLATLCTAWHWVNPIQTMAEMARVIAPGGVFVVLRNGRLPHPVLDAFTAYFATLNPQGEDHARREARKLPGLDFLAAQPGFADPSAASWPWQNEMECQALIDLWLTRATAWEVVRRVGLTRVLGDLRALCAQHMPKGQVTLHWETQAQWVRRT